MSLDVSEAVSQYLSSDCAHSIEPALEALDDRDVAALAREIRNSGAADERMIVRAIALLGRGGREELVDALGDARSMRSDALRLAAADALGRLGTPRAIPAIDVLLQATDPQVRKFAVRSLAQSTDADAQGRLRQIAREDSASLVRRKAEQMLKLR